MADSMVPVCSTQDFNAQWAEITPEFFECVKEMELGELLHDSMFGLFEAMSAIEMMDPKMDAGMVCNRGKKRALTFDQAVKEGKLKLDKLTPAEQMAVIDTTFACLVTWLEGHSLAQTVFTNLYLHRPHEVKDHLVNAFSICILKLIDTIKEYVNRASVFEEEDFQPVVYGFRLAVEISDQKAVAMLREVEDELQRKCRSTRARPGEKEGERDPALEQAHRSASGLHARLRFLRLLYQALLCFGRRDPSSLTECQRFLSGCKEALAMVAKEGVMEASCGEDGSESVLGFEPMVNQRLLPPTFPRYTRLKSRKEAFLYLEQLLVRLQHACRVANCASFHSAMDFFLEFSQQSPCVLSRSVLQLLYLPPCNRVLGANPLTEVLKDSARSFICPPVLASKSPLMSNPQAREYLETFMSHCARPFVALLQICGHNRARQRDKLAHILEEFANLQDEAERVDAYLHNLGMKSDSPRSHLACFGTWILYHTLRVMVRYLLSGFELELYSPHEFRYVYWYLYEFLYGWLASSCSRADGILAEQEALADMGSGGGGGSGGGRSGGGRGAKGRAKARKKKGARPISRDVALSQALQAFSGAYYKAMTALHVDGRILRPNPEFDNEQVRYEHRFSPFSSVRTPPLVHYSQYLEMTALVQEGGIMPTAASLYVSACRLFHQTRTLLEMVQPPDDEVHALLKITKTNFVVMKLLAGGHKKDQILPPEFDFSLHLHFPIIKLV